MNLYKIVLVNMYVYILSDNMINAIKLFNSKFINEDNHTIKQVIRHDKKVYVQKTKRDCSVFLARNDISEAPEYFIIAEDYECAAIVDRNAYSIKFLNITLIQ